MSVRDFETKLFINNEVYFHYMIHTSKLFCPRKSGKTFPLYSPVADKETCQVHEALAEDVDLAVQAAQKAFPEWSNTDAFQRALPMAKFAQLILRDVQELAELDALAMGKPVELLKKMDVPAAASIFSYYAGAAYHVLGESSLNNANFLNVSVRQPYGVVGLIIPWNVSLIMFAMKVAPAVICGNAVVVKASEKAPLSSLKLASLIREAGFPPGVINVVNGYGTPTGQAIAEHMKIRKIAFTGSVGTGRKIMRMAADSNLKNVTLELGGKSPAIIFEDADIRQAARSTHYSINHNSGQHCQANSRVLVHESIAEEYLSELKSLMSRVSLGDPFFKSTFQGYGTLVHVGKRHGVNGAFIEPTIFVNVPNSSPIYQEEVFGPVVIVNTFTSEEDALAEANSTDFGLFFWCRGGELLGAVARVGYAGWWLETIRSWQGTGNAWVEQFHGVEDHFSEVWG
ncbi:aldehyde dehydrogenase [Hyaloscypha variabilis F]|uniref:aldehyde dehydrogenase (NAD(+)) n=1 Tax=Hyaloscypha variabilis (strain UAMH 11265 / GT02V1 / F) TaxID=1149755 RepID=A0A2J6QTR4_HYAVF|nr:aldehyde dehydrogenase [Hyaloscypha variabilis F]